METVPPRDRKGLRTGFTTGACAAAAAKAATRVLVGGAPLTEIESTLPNRSQVTFKLHRCDRTGDRAICSIIKDAGDDPDCTHGAELVAEVELRDAPGIELRGGPGVATVTKPGLGLTVGDPAINPVPRRNIIEMVEQELAAGARPGAVVTISVPRGEEMAKETTNAKLGLLGGISILGTTGIVQPYSTAAFKASVIQEIDVAATAGHRELVLTTGGKSEQYAMQLHPHLGEQAFVQVGDFIGVGVRHCARRNVDRAIVVGMIGKLSKMAAGKLQTHVAGSEVDLGLLATFAVEAGASEALADKIRAANTARHVLELCRAEGVVGITRVVCERVAGHLTRAAGGALAVHVLLVDFGGALLGRYPDLGPDLRPDTQETP
jgi:cobalt-precorrin-5B (C1)-methyltransferase